MWFIFPQFAGLGHSAMAQRFAIASRDEVVTLSGVLESRLRECTPLVNAVEDRTIRDILGNPDDLKFRSSMTSFGAVSSDPEFAAAISKFYGGKPDPIDTGLARALDRRAPDLGRSGNAFHFRRLAHGQKTGLRALIDFAA
jgi:uncharacterized protein (DUF1810 family)